MSSFLIKNALIVDGTGASPFHGSVLLDDGQIRAVFPGDRHIPADNSGRYTLDAHGHVLAPGFIDAHSHSDMSLLVEPDAFGKISQGITTEVNGNCGLSPFPVTAINREHLEELYANYNTPVSWNSFSEYAAALSLVQPAVNVMSLCGYNTMRAAVSGYEKNDLSPAMIAAVQSLLHDCLKQGVGGLSSGLLYIPGKFASAEEIVSVLKVLRPFNRPYTTHLRSEGPRLLESLQEAIDCSMRAGIPRLHISHLKTSGKANWAKLDQALFLIEQAIHNGLTVTADRYPYIESMTTLSMILPSPYDDLDDLSLGRLLQSADERHKLLSALNVLDPERWVTTRLVNTAVPEYCGMLGLSLHDIAERVNLPPPQVCTDLLAGDAAGTMAAYRGMNEDNMRRIMALPYTVCGTDETARPQSYRLGRSHPRGFGSFPEFHRALSPGMTLPAIVHKMTQLPASIFGMKNRGRIAPGMAGDLVLFDPDKFTAHADFAEPHLPATGVFHVFVNGAPAYSNGMVLNRAGRVLLQ